MSEYFTFPMPILQSVGLICVPTGTADDAGWIERKPVAAAVLTMSQGGDGRISIFHEVATAVDERQFPLPWLVEQELVAGVPTLVGAGDIERLAVEAAQKRFFVESKIASLHAGGDHAIDVAGLAGDGISEKGLCRRLNIPLDPISETEVERIWNCRSDTRVIRLGRHALASSVSRLMLWANLMAMRESEPGWFYETMLALRCWVDERERDAPTLYSWGMLKPIMSAVSYVDEYRRDLARRAAGQPSDWPRFASGLFHT